METLKAKAPIGEKEVHEESSWRRNKALGQHVMKLLVLLVLKSKFGTLLFDHSLVFLLQKFRYFRMRS